MAQLMRSQTMPHGHGHGHISHLDPSLEQWRAQQERLAEQRELEELIRKVEAKKLETRKWVLDQQRWDLSTRPPHERRATALVPAAGRSVTPTAVPTQPRSKTPTQPRSRTPGTERPSVVRRATEVAPARPITPTPIQPLRPRAAPRSTTMPTSIPGPVQQKAAPAANPFSPEIEEIRVAAESWMRDWRRVDEEVRARADAEEAKTRAIQDSVRRMQAKIGPPTPQQTDDERRASPEIRMARAFATYCEKWNALHVAAPHQLTFKTIPWPVAAAPASPAAITLAAVSSFLLSPSHSLGKTTRQRAREALRVWHPDKWFTTWLKYVPDQERAQVIEGVNAVAHHLNALAMSSSG
ncbi:hypothetical protein EXIGLDRAFT_722362 [Exidia glandulosa HHB12029]|uniref:Uncharacterized protein n=1 Tax=Exidia glandulosa HHB12029 TaxID=1314781 RepID=A0A165N6Y2_EXIGL|nr:hypothetical protein EXIGLDRAFT_722362 [Exidia glandulosa HHB12029]